MQGNIPQLFNDAFFRADLVKNAVSDCLDLSSVCAAPTEHRHWHRALDGKREMPQRTTASVDLSLHTDVDRQAGAYAQFNPPMMPRNDLCQRIKDWVAQRKFSVRVRSHGLPASPQKPSCTASV